MSGHRAWADLQVPLTTEAVARIEMMKADHDRIQFLVDFLDSEGLLEDHCFTFPDGEVWDATGRGQ